LPSRDKANDDQHRNRSVSHYVNERRTQVVITVNVRILMNMNVAMVVAVPMMMVVIITQKKCAQQINA